MRDLWVIDIEIVVNLQVCGSPDKLATWLLKF